MRTGTIMLVDDEPRNRHLLKGLLDADGHRVIEASTGAEALELIGRTPPDVVLLDVKMPGMNGFEVCRRLKSNPETAPIPVLLVTGLTERKDLIQGMAAGADDFLLKPPDSVELVLRVRNAVYRMFLYKELAKKYEELKAMEELQASLTSMLEANAEALSSIFVPMQSGDQAANCDDTSGEPTQPEGPRQGTN